MGILVGLSVLSWVNANDPIDRLATVGITLLILVGLKPDLANICTLGPVALAARISQVALTRVIRHVIAWAMGMTPIAALCVALALTFSSPVILVKLLSGKREGNTLHRRIAQGFLIV